MITREEALKTLVEIMNIPNIMDLRHPNVINVFGKLEKYINQQPQLSKDVEEALEYIGENYQLNIRKAPMGLLKRSIEFDTIKQHIQAQASEIEELRKLNEGKAKEYFKLLKIYHILDAKLNAIREVVEEIQSHKENKKERYVMTVNTVYEIFEKLQQILGDS